MKQITTYFPGLDAQQIRQLEALGALYRDWNSKINLISRKDIDALYEKHILHSLAIAKFIQFVPGTQIIDIGTGGGFPGIPLAILFPQVRFHLIDSIGKKIRVVNEIIKAVELRNATASQIRAEQVQDRYDFIVSRAVTRLPRFIELSAHLIGRQHKNEIKNGILYLKGGELDTELSALPPQWYYRIENISTYFKEDFFETKKLVYLYL